LAPPLFDNNNNNNNNNNNYNKQQQQLHPKTTPSRAGAWLALGGPSWPTITIARGCQWQPRLLAATVCRHTPAKCPAPSLGLGLCPAALGPPWRFICKQRGRLEMEQDPETLVDIKTSYCRAIRCWQSNNLASCLQLCNQITLGLNNVAEPQRTAHSLASLKQLVWMLKIKCLAEDCYVNEALLLNEDDLDTEDQVCTFTATTSATAKRRSGLIRQDATATSGAPRPKSGRPLSAGRWSGTGGLANQRRTGIITGRMPSASSRRTSGAGRATSSYRPLTTSLTATQTAFSRSTQPLLRYANNHMLDKIVFEYLYNVQKVTNKCPDYRQCLEYLNSVQQNYRDRWARLADQSATVLPAQRKRKDLEQKANHGQRLVDVLDDSDTTNGRELLDCFWLIAFGTCYFNLAMHKLAMDYFVAAKESNPRHLDAYLWLVKIYLRLNEPIRVLKTCDEGIANCKNAIMFNWKARVQSLLFDTYAAHATLKDSLHFYPTNIEALANVGHFHFYADKMEQALDCFQRIHQLSMNSLGLSDGLSSDQRYPANASSELLNNLALCNYYAGNITKVLPYFQQAFLGSPNKETTSNIWYNLSFVPLGLGFVNLSIACLNMAIKSDSQNEEAINNLGVLKYGPKVNDPLHYKNKQESWDIQDNLKDYALNLKNCDSQEYRRNQIMFNEAESYFSTPGSLVDISDDGLEPEANGSYFKQTEMLLNMAVVKYQRGQLLSSVKYCQNYLEYDQNNYMVLNLMREIKQLVSHDS